MASDKAAVVAAIRLAQNKQDLIKLCGSKASDLVLDPDTANYHLKLSDSKKKATKGARQDYTDRPERFSVHPQVLSRDPLSGAHYWEVEWSSSSSESTYVGLAYNQIERKSDSWESQLGNNEVSWCFGQFAAPRKLRAWHNGLVWEGPFPDEGCSRLGVFLDWSNGILAFFNASSPHFTLLYLFETSFSEPVYPGFWAARDGNYVKVCEFY